jgi:aspartyl-tRNA(Asn)/glutamyl-tRNA(Gln) amidotransferase subunit A
MFGYTPTADSTGMNSELPFLMVADAARLIETCRLSPVELTRACLARIEAFDGGINAFNTVTAERALRQE